MSSVLIVRSYVKLLLFISLLVSSTFGAQLGVLYNDTNSNVVSPLTLKIGTVNVTNVNLLSGVASRALATDASSNIVISTLTSVQQGYLASLIVSNNNLLLGTANVLSSANAPTNGVGPSGSLYLRTGVTNAFLSTYISDGTNWYLAFGAVGTNITEANINLSDVTTGNSTTGRHGFMPKLSGDANQFLNGTNGFTTPVQMSTTDLHIPLVNQVPGAPNLGNTDMGVLAGNWTLENNRRFTVPRLAVTNGVASSLLRFDSLNNVTNAAIGAGLSFDGTTLSVTGVGTNTINSSGSPLANQVTYWTSPTQISGDTDFTFDGTTVTASAISVTNLTSANLSVTSTNGNVYSGTYTPTVVASFQCTLVGVSTQYPCNYIRIGNIVTVTGRARVARTTASNNFWFSLSLPVPRTSGQFSAVTDAEGFGNVTYEDTSLFIAPAKIYAITGTSPAYVAVESMAGFTAGQTGTLRDIRFTFSYIVQ